MEYSSMEATGAEYNSITHRHIRNTFIGETLGTVRKLTVILVSLNTRWVNHFTPSLTLTLIYLFISSFLSSSFALFYLSSIFLLSLSHTHLSPALLFSNTSIFECELNLRAWTGGKIFFWICKNQFYSLEGYLKDPTNQWWHRQNKKSK